MGMQRLWEEKRVRKQAIREKRNTGGRSQRGTRSQLLNLSRMSKTRARKIWILREALASFCQTRSLFHLLGRSTRQAVRRIYWLNIHLRPHLILLLVVVRIFRCINHREWTCTGCILAHFSRLSWIISLINRFNWKFLIMIALINKNMDK